MYYAFTPNSVFKLVPPLGSEPTWQTCMLYSDIVPLIYVNETICMVICPSSRFKLIILWPKMNHLVPRLSQREGPGAILSFKTFLSFINRLHSCLENTMGGGAWWAAIHGVAKSRTWLRTSLSCIGEGNGNPLQCSCLDNPRDGGAW